MDFKDSFFSPGKLLITGEYLVIDGAKSLALPTKKGQWLRVNPNSLNEINWVSLDAENEIWFEGRFSTSDFTIIESSNIEVATKLQEILAAAASLDFNQTLNKGWIIQTVLDFPNNWGLGSSSTLLCNIAKWLKIDAYKLHFTVSNGSGYDIASGMESAALIYTVNNQEPNIEKITFKPIYKNAIYFVHLNQKQQSDKEVSKYTELKKEVDLPNLTKKIGELTADVINAQDLPTFEKILSEHEQILSFVLQRETSQEDLFKDYNGGVTKYLGAWGGDFVLVTANDTSSLAYFQDKGYHTILSFDEMIML